MSNLSSMRSLYQFDNLDVVNERDLKIVETNFTNFFDEKSDQFIWTAFKQDDESAYVYIYQKYFAGLINYGSQFTKDDQLLEDCIQDLFIDLKNNKSNLTDKNSSIKLYLFKSLKRRIIEYRRKANKLIFEHAGEEKTFEIVLSVETLLIEKQLKEEQLIQLRKAKEKLTGRQREVLYYLFHEELNYQEIQELMGFDHVRSVRNIFYKAVTVLKTSFKILLLVRFA